MYRRHLITIIFFAVLTYQNYTSHAVRTKHPEKKLVFSADKSLLSKCIENYLITTEFYTKIRKGTKTVATHTAKHFSSTSTTKKDFDQDFKLFFFDLQLQRSKLLKKNSKFTSQERSLLKKAVEYCADEKNLPTGTSLPVFEDETPEVSTVLDFILVQWTFHPFFAIQSRNGRSLLRRYVNDALAALVRALGICQDVQVFRLALRVLWNRRAQVFFDGRNNTRDPYIPYRYTTDHIHANDIDRFLHRRDVSFEIRNPMEPRSSVDELLNVHAVERPGVGGGFDFFEAYNNTGISSADRFLERQIDAFYRLLFFFIELGRSGVATDDEDLWQGAIPFEVVIHRIQTIIYDDDYYREYLLWERFLLESFTVDPKNRYLQGLQRSSRVCEEDLIMLKLNMLNTNKVVFLTTTTSTTTLRSVSSTSRSKKKGSVVRNDQGKCFVKRPRMTFPDSCCSDGSNIGGSDNDKFTYFCLKKRYSYQVTGPNDRVFDLCFRITEAQKMCPIKNNVRFGYLAGDVVGPADELPYVVKMESVVFGNSVHEWM